MLHFRRLFVGNDESMQPLGGKGFLVRFALAAWTMVVVTLGSVEAQDAVYLEDQVKAAFLYHFGTYVQWPTEPPSGTAITIAVLGAPRVVEQLEAFLPGRTIQGRPVVARRLAAIGDLADEDVLFIGAEHNGDLRTLIETVGQRPILIVTDARNGLAEGAMINFQLVDQRLRFEISLLTAENAGLMLSSRLLSAALRVETADCLFPCSHRHVPRLPNFAHRHTPALALLHHSV